MCMLYTETIMNVQIPHGGHKYFAIELPLHADSHLNLISITLFSVCFQMSKISFFFTVHDLNKSWFLSFGSSHWFMTAFELFLPDRTTGY